jgi:hypothetical protein
LEVGRVLQTRTDDFYALQHSAFPFYELVWPTTSTADPVVAPRGFHFTITLFTMDRGSLNRADI